MFKTAAGIFRITNKIFKYNSGHVRYVSKNVKNENRASYSVSVLFSKKYLFASNTITSGALMLLGDLCQQEIEFRQNKLEKRYDFGRLTRMFIVGLALGPIHHYYYIYIAKKWPERTTKIIFWKIMLDQVVMSPICITLFFFGLGLLEFKPLYQTSNELKEKFLPIYTVDWCIWPPTQYINFCFIPVKYQVLYINAATMLYNVFLSYIKHRKSEKDYKQHEICVD